MGNGKRLVVLLSDLNYMSGTGLACRLDRGTRVWAYRAFDSVILTCGKHQHVLDGEDDGYLWRFASPLEELGRALDV